MDIKEKNALSIFDLYHSQVLRMNDIVLGLINLIELKNTEKLQTKIDFDKLTDACLHSCQYLPGHSLTHVEKNIQVFDFHSEWAIINTILQNLIENAIKYCRPNNQPFVKISILPEGRGIAITVEDNGQGILQTYHDKIFNMFYRANDRVQGSGLGLYILKRAVEKLNGSIDFSSTPDVGSVFTIYIPE